MQYLRADSADTEAAGLLQRCRLLTHSAGITNKTWAIDDYLIAHSDVKFNNKVIGYGTSTKVEEAELFGIVCAIKMPYTHCSNMDTDSEVGDLGPSSLNLGSSSKPKLDDRGWSVSNPQRSLTEVKLKVPLRKCRSHSFDPTPSNNSLSLTTRLSGAVSLDGFAKILKECRMLSTLRHPNIVQFYGVCWLEEGEATKVAIVIEEFMLLTLREVATSFKDKLGEDIPLAMKLSLLSDTARGLAYLHSHAPSIIHPDMDASDVMISSAMVAKITDLCNAQFGSSKQQDVHAFGQISACTIGLSPEELKRPTTLTGTESELVSILIPCFSSDTQSRPPIPKLLNQLEQLAKRVPFQLSQMGSMMVAIKEWKRERLTESPEFSEAHPLKPSASIEELLKVKDQQLIELQVKNSELVATNQTIERQLAEQEEQLQRAEPTEIKLSDMLADLHQVVGWLLLGIHLDVPLSDLQKIRHQFNENVDQCKTEMLITYSKLKEPSWVDIVDALRRSGERALAVRLARKHGVTLTEEVTESQEEESVSVLLPNGTSEVESDVKELVHCIHSKDSELQSTIQQLHREQASKEDLERELTHLKESLSSMDGGVGVQQSRQTLTQQLFLKERERHYLSLVSMGQQNQKNKSMHGNEIDVILVEKDMEIHRMKTQLKEIESQFRMEKTRSDELKTKLISLESEVTIKDAHIGELENSKKELNKYLADERQRVDMLLMKVVPPPSVQPVSPVSPVIPVPPISPPPVTVKEEPVVSNSSTEFEPVKEEPVVSNSRTEFEPTPVKNCCVIV